MTLPTKALLEIIRHYTREAGVRNLEREIGSCCRKLARKFVAESVAEDFKDVVDAERVREMLGPIKFRQQGVAAESEIGLATGLAWTEIGGEVLQIEATLTKGRGGVTLTGKLGDVMQESAQAALTCIKARAERLAMSLDFIRKRDLHIHIPEGAIPKDGPSAGITMATAMASALTRAPIRKNVAMTGEITLRGRVLADRRRERKTSGGASLRHRHDHPAERQRKGSARSSGRSSQRALHQSGRND